MSSGNTFYRRLAGNWLQKATGLKHEDGRIPDDYSYIELKGTVGADLEQVGVIVEPEVPVDIKLRCFVEVNPRLFLFGACNNPSIVESGDSVGVLIRCDSSELEDFLADSWAFRLYVAR